MALRAAPTGYAENEGLESWLRKEEPEPVLEPELPIVDPHHHLWDNRSQPERAARFKQRVYLLPELLADVGAGHNVVQTVYVQAGAFHLAGGPEEFRPLGEVEFVQGVAAMTESGTYGAARVAGAIVGTCDLSSPRAERVLRAMMAASRNFRGIRCPIGSGDEFLRGFAALERLGLSYDVWQRDYADIPKVTALARRFPGVTIILNHLGGLVGPKMSGAALEQWKRDIKEAAGCPNVVCKVGGAQMATNGWGFEGRASPVGSEELCRLMLPFYGHALDCFGPRRCMFESNFPVDRECVSYRTLWNMFKRVAAAKGLSAAEKDDVFRGTATRVYRLAAPSSKL